MAENQNNIQGGQGAPSLSELGAGVKLPQEKTRKRSHKRTVISVFAFLILMAVTVFFVYKLMQGKRVDLKTDRNLAEKVSSGKDLRQAAFDSISGSLNGPAAQPSPMITPRSPVPSSTRTAGNDGEKVDVPLQSKISDTLAPPPEALLAGSSEDLKHRGQAIGSSRNTTSSANSSSDSAPLSKTNNNQSIRYAPTVHPVKAVGDNANAKTALPDKAGGGQSEVMAHRQSHFIKSSSRPSFGTMMPVRLMGMLYTLRTGSLARLELARDLKTERWQLKRGTVFIGNVAGGDLDRAYIQIKGNIDPETQAFTKLEGEVLGNDGGAGLRGKKRQVSSVWVKILDRAAQAGVQIGSSVLGRGGSSVIVATDPYGIYRSTAGNNSQADQNRSFVEVPAGSVGFILVTTMPEAEPSNPYLANSSAKTGSLTDDELAELMGEADPERIRAALSRMSPDLQRVAQAVLKEIEPAKP